MSEVSGHGERDERWSGRRKQSGEERIYGRQWRGEGVYRRKKELPIRRITLSNHVGHWHRIYYYDWKTGSIAETILEKSQVVGVPKTMDIDVMAGGAIYVDSPYDYAGGIDVTPAQYVKASVKTDSASKRMIDDSSEMGVLSMHFTQLKRGGIPT